MSCIQGKVRGSTGEQSVRFLIDSGAIYSLLPELVWQAIGLAPKRETDFPAVMLRWTRSSARE